jgi:alanine racemase
VSDCRPTVAEVDLDALARNLAAVRSMVRGLGVWAVVKADAYGHGAVPVARRLEVEGVEGFCVATASEGAELREAGITRPVLVMGPLSGGGAVDPFSCCVEHRLSVSVPDGATAEALRRAVRAAGRGSGPVHLKVDTGMGRLGLMPQETLEMARMVSRSGELTLEGLFTNLATADATHPDDPAYGHVRAQVDAFRETCRLLERDGVLPPVRTVANSAAAEHHALTVDPAFMTATRPGLVLYGATATPGNHRAETKPVMRFATRVTSIREMPASVSIGYGIDTFTRRRTRVAVLPLGYHDGLPRAMGPRGQVWLRGRRAPIIGRISMDITLVDVTDVSGAEAGDEVVLFGGSGGAAGDDPAVSVEEVAEWAETIPHEVLCRVGSRVPRRYLGEEPSGTSR